MPVWAYYPLGFIVIFAAVAVYRMGGGRRRDPRLDRDWGGKTGKHDSPARRPR